MPKCGKCKKTGVSVKHIKACYGLIPFREGGTPISIVQKEHERKRKTKKSNAVHREKIKSKMLLQRQKEAQIAKQKMIKITNAEKNRLARQRILETKYKFRCLNCHREFVSTSTPQPSCNKCQDRTNLRCVCKICNELLPPSAIEKKCRNCKFKDAEIRLSRKEGLQNAWRTGKHSKGT